MILENLILRRAEKKILPYRAQVTTLPTEITAAYQQRQSEINTLYNIATHWHGTGRYHYQNGDDSRYSEVNTDETVDILEAIIIENGLKPHYDPWIKSNGKTVSLATTRMHARAFALIHTPTADLLKYELGSITFWLRLYFSLLFVWFISNLWSHRAFIRDTLRTSFSKDIQTWASAIRKPKHGQVVSIFDIFRGNIPTSDIAANYPILIGIHIHPDSLINTIPLTHKVERRSLQPITLEMITHIEVPLAKVSETEACLAQHNLTIPVLPLECGDMYVADIPLRNLAFSE